MLHAAATKALRHFKPPQLIPWRMITPNISELTSFSALRIGCRYFVRNSFVTSNTNTQPMVVSESHNAVVCVISQYQSWITIYVIQVLHQAWVAFKLKTGLPEVFREKQMKSLTTLTFMFVSLLAHKSSSYKRLHYAIIQSSLLSLRGENYNVHSNLRRNSHQSESACHAWWSSQGCVCFWT